jgi:DNA polymerase III subunit delta
MTALKGQEIDRFLAKPEKEKKIILLYGPDNGLVRERGKQLLKSWGAKPDDAFSFVTLDEHTLKDDPARLGDEALSINMFGEIKTLHLRVELGQSLVEALKFLLESKLDNRILIEAGDLKPTAPLRVLGEKSTSILTLPCYADTAQDLARVLEDELKTAQKSMSREAKELFLSLLGGDRALSRGEIHKLLLYTQDKNEISQQDVIDSSSDSSQTLMDELIDAAFSGQTGKTLKLYQKTIQSEFNPITVHIFLTRHTLALLKARLKIENGASAQSAVETFEPRLHFKRKSLVEAHLKAHSCARLAQEIEKQHLISSDIRLKPQLSETLLARTLMGLAMRSRR